MQQKNDNVKGQGKEEKKIQRKKEMKYKKRSKSEGGRGRSSMSHRIQGMTPRTRESQVLFLCTMRVRNRLHVP